MTAYNREKYIAEAIESVLVSTYTNFELIIVDDCSVDNTVQIAKEFAAKDNRIKVFLNEKNLGDYPNRNRAVSYAEGEFIMFVDSDDKILADGMERCVKTLLEFPESNFGMYSPENLNSPLFLTPQESIQRNFFQKPFLGIGPGGTILKRNFLTKINGYPEKYGPANDMFFNLKAACNGNLILLPFDFVYYRIHAGQEINNSYSYLYNNYKYLNDALKELPLGLNDNQKAWLLKKSKRRFFTNICKYFFTTFNYKKTQFAIKQAGYTFKDAMIGVFHFD